MPRFEIRIPRICDDVELVEADTRGKAKNKVFQEIRGHFEWLQYTDIKARLVKEDDSAATTPEAPAQAGEGLEEAA